MKALFYGGDPNTQQFCEGCLELMPLNYFVKSIYCVECRYGTVDGPLFIESLQRISMKEIS